MWGYRKADKEVRVPVVIYENLSRAEEARLFIDINENQKKVSDELILDVKRLLALESDDEKTFSTIFYMFLTKDESVLKEYINVGERNRGNLSRLVFNNAISGLVKGHLQSLDDAKRFEVINNYLRAFRKLFLDISPELNKAISKTIIFQSKMSISEFVTLIAYDKYHKLDERSYYETVKAIKGNLPLHKIKKPGKSYKAFSEQLKEAMIRKTIPSTIIT